MLGRDSRLVYFACYENRNSIRWDKSKPIDAQQGFSTCIFRLLRKPKQHSLGQVKPDCVIAPNASPLYAN
jgi:hypothetical protein